MIWQSNDNHGVAILNERMVGQLNTYLEKKEAILSLLIKDAIHLDRSASSLLEGGKSFTIRLSEAIEEFGKKVHLVGEMKEPKAISPSWKMAANQISEALWNYISVLEGCVVELFQQIDQIGFEHWDLSMSRNVTNIKDDLTHRMEDLIWAIRRLEQQLKSYRSIEMSYQSPLKNIGQTCLFWLPLLERSLEITSRKCQKYLNFRYNKFITRYTGCVQLYEAAEKPLIEIRTQKNHALKDVDLLDKFERLYHLLVLWDLNHQSRTLPMREPIRALRRLTTAENALALFHEYLKAIREALFKQSILLKKGFSLHGESEETSKILDENVSGYRFELRLLQGAITKYKKFLLHVEQLNHHNRRFFNWCKRQPSKSVIRLSNLIQECNHLDKLCTEFQMSLQSPQKMERRLTPQIENEINHHLHELAQPLASRDFMRRHFKIVLGRLNSLDELGAFHEDVVDYNSRVLCQLMVVDWKHHVLFDNPLFFKLFEIHQNIVAVESESTHATRFNKFRHLIKQLEQWVETRNTASHAQDIGLDINDIRAYLQDFLAQVQRLEQNQPSTNKQELRGALGKARYALLEYLYMFGKFFHKLHPNEPEEWLLRKQLLFVDQYFESIEEKLRELEQGLAFFC